MKKLAWLLFVWVPVVSWAQAQTEATLAQFHDRLALTTQQQAYWSAFESRVDAYTSAYYRQKPVLAASEDAAPHQLARLVDNLQNRLAALEEVESAAKNLYASLIPDQQMVANQMLILTIPTFSSPGAIQRPDENRRKDGKPEAGKRSHRGGAGLGGQMSGN
jgi:hypothetical protein